jgi:hypothetical protein
MPRFFLALETKLMYRIEVLLGISQLINYQYWAGFLSGFSSVAIGA